MHCFICYSFQVVTGLASVFKVSEYMLLHRIKKNKTKNKRCQILQYFLSPWDIFVCGTIDFWFYIIWDWGRISHLLLTWASSIVHWGRFKFPFVLLRYYILISYGSWRHKAPITIYLCISMQTGTNIDLVWLWKEFDMIISMHGLKISLHEHSRNSTQFSQS